MTNWKWTSPTGPAGHPTETILSADAFFSSPPWLSRPAWFRANCGGTTTSNSGYPRSELREMDGDRLASWSSKSGVHQMSLTQAITHLPVKKPHVVAGQIHDAKDDVLMVRLEGEHLFVERDGDNVGTLDDHYALGTTFKVTLQASKSGITVYYAKTPTAARVKVKVPGVTGTGWYFKAGCYTQSNTSKGDAADAYGEVVICALTVSHI